MKGPAMEYSSVVTGKFISRPNRFIANVELDGAPVVCHVKNTGRCRELLVPGAAVVLSRAENPARRTAFDLIAVHKGGRLINIDSQAPNKLAAEYLPSLFPGSSLRPECVFGASRLDFRVDTPAGPAYVEVKGVTLESGGHAMFPDAPTQRGTRHLHELMSANAQGFGAYLLFVAQFDGCLDVSPNDATDPAFGLALRQAKAAGVGLLAVSCRVSDSSMTPANPVPVLLP